MKLRADNWEGLSPNRTEIEDPRWEQVVEAVRCLDGQRRTQVTILREDFSNCLVGGGPDRFSVSVTTAEDDIYTLLNPQGRADVEELLIVGGQRGRYPQNVLVSRELATQAARSFFESGSPDAALSWQSE